MSSMAALCALSLWTESTHFSTDSISVRYCFTDYCAARMSCSVAVEGSGKVLGALGPWQLSARPVVAYKLPTAVRINRGTIPRIRRLQNENRAYDMHAWRLSASFA